MMETCTGIGNMRGRWITVWGREEMMSSILKVEEPRGVRVEMFTVSTGVKYELEMEI